jgi:tRNA threonylcarbamoyladenosine biosynthesis protein TsaB
LGEPVILALEASGESASAALRLPGGRVLQRLSAGEKQSAFLLPAVDALLAEAGLSLRDVGLVAVGRGPGAFTGVRFALSVAQGLAFGLGVPAVGVSTLAALALDGARRADAGEGETVLALLDARMGELYGGLYRIGGKALAEPLGEEFLAAPGAFPGWVRRAPFRLAAGAVLGSHPRLLPWREAGEVRAVPDARPRAGAVAELGLASWRLGLAGPAAALAPTYLRDKVALTETERRSQQP